VNGMCKISLRPDAIHMLEEYRWPGNIRQLQGFTQSLTAQVSVKVTPTLQRIELDARELQPFMPREQGDPIPVVYEGPGASAGSSFSAEERQAIFKAIFDLKQDVDALKARLDRPELPVSTTPLPEEEEAEWQEQEDFSNLSVRRNEEELIRQALEKYHGNRKKAAEELGMSERTLYRKLPPEYRKK
ncbi:MAG: hypothetical protein IKG92_02960, partial [Bacteroidales bacterium]|nr:hypothetical protein [Bacteroidales bacterium]